MNIRVFRPFCNTQRRGGRTNAAAGNERVAPSIDLSFTAHVGTLLVGSVRLSPVRIGQTKALLLGPMPGPVDPARILVAELVDGAFDGVSGPIRAE